MITNLDCGYSHDIFLNLQESYLIPRIHPSTWATVRSAGDRYGSKKLARLPSEIGALHPDSGRIGVVLIRAVTAPSAAVFGFRPASPVAGRDLTFPFRPEWIPRQGNAVPLRRDPEAGSCSTARKRGCCGKGGACCHAIPGLPWRQPLRRCFPPCCKDDQCPVREVGVADVVVVWRVGRDNLVGREALLLCILL